MFFLRIMPVIRIKHKARVAVLLPACVIILFLLISKYSYSKNDVENYIENFPTRSVDFIKIVNEAIKDEKEDTKTGVYGTVGTRGKLSNRLRNVPQPPKRRISDGAVDRKVEKNVVHGDDQTGEKGRAHRNRKRIKVKPTSRIEHEQVVKTTKLPKASPYTIAVLVIACNRPNAVKRCLNSLLKHRPSSKQFPIIVSQDCGDEATAQAISTYGDTVKHIKQPDLSSVDVPGNMRHFEGYYKISRHFKWALGQLFDEMSYDTVLIVEDDLEIAPDFYDYFLATRAIMDQDPSIWCVSAWNDNGKAGMVDGNSKLLYRADFFPGLGWMLTKSLWNELRGKWPAGFWDDWMRDSKQRQGRACIRPEISRTKTFGRIGVSQGQFYDEHLKYIVLNDKKVDFLHEDLSYLLKNNYDKNFLGKVSALPLFNIQDILSLNIRGHKSVRVTYSRQNDFNSLAKNLGAMVDFKAGVPRTGYHGVVTVIFKGVRVYLTPENIKK